MRTRRQRTSSDPMSPENHGHRYLQSPSEVGHIPVLLHESLETLSIQTDDIVLDATLGRAGHAHAIIQKLGSRGTYIGIDSDASAIRDARSVLHGSAHVVLETANFRDLDTVLLRHHVPHISKALFDLGWNSLQLTAGRGFSFRNNEPLVMTYAETPGEELTAHTIVNEWEEENIESILYGWGEERFARRIAHAIVEARALKSIEFSRDLAEIVTGAVPPFVRRGRVHPATKTFQALRIAVNDELGALREGLAKAWRVLSSRGRIAVITFHSIEDREVKTMMRQWSDAGEGERIIKSPLRPSRAEIVSNPRSRSAKLRCIEKV